MTTEKIIQLKNHKHFNRFLILGVIVILYITYRLYIWSNTQSTDNAYLDSDIAYINPQVQGIIKKVFVTDNMPVKKDDIIAEIDDERYKANWTKVESDVNLAIDNIKIIDQKTSIATTDLKKAEEALNFTKTNFELTDVNYKRIIELKKDKFISQKVLDDTKIAREQARSNYDTAKLELEKSRQNLELLAMEKFNAEEQLKGLYSLKTLAQRDLSDTVIRAPLDGRLANSNLQVGNIAAPGSTLFLIVPDNNLYIVANFKETQIAKLNQGMKVAITFDAIKGQEFYGTIRNISPAAGSKFSIIPPDNATGNFTKVVQRVPVYIDFPMPKDKAGKPLNLVPGMSVIVSVRTDQ